MLPCRDVPATPEHRTARPRPVRRAIALGGRWGAELLLKSASHQERDATGVSQPASATCLEVWAWHSAGARETFVELS